MNMSSLYISVRYSLSASVRFAQAKSISVNILSGVGDSGLITIAIAKHPTAANDAPKRKRNNFLDGRFFKFKARLTFSSISSKASRGTA